MLNYTFQRLCHCRVCYRLIVLYNIINLLIKYTLMLYHLLYTLLKALFLVEWNSKFSAKQFAYVAMLLLLFTYMLFS